MGVGRDRGIPGLGSEWSLTFLQCLDWKRFEELCAEMLSLAGYDVGLRQEGMEAGFDLLMRPVGEAGGDIAVRCAREVHPIKLSEVQSFYAKTLGAGMERAIFLTRNSFTVPVYREYGEDEGFELVDGWQILDGIEDLGRTASDHLLRFAREGVDWYVPSCQQCQTKMALRRPLLSSGSGEPYWACVNFSRLGCREILPLPEEGPIRTLVLGFGATRTRRGGALRG